MARWAISRTSRRWLSPAALRAVTSWPWTMSRHHRCGRRGGDFQREERAVVVGEAVPGADLQTERLGPVSRSWVCTPSRSHCREMANSPPVPDGKACLRVLVTTSVKVSAHGQVVEPPRQHLEQTGGDLEVVLDPVADLLEQCLVGQGRGQAPIRRLRRIERTPSRVSRLNPPKMTASTATLYPMLSYHGSRTSSTAAPASTITGQPSRRRWLTRRSTPSTPETARWVPATARDHRKPDLRSSAISGPD